MSSCCGSNKHKTGFKSIDWIFSGSLTMVTFLMLFHFVYPYFSENLLFLNAVTVPAQHVIMLIDSMWAGVLVGIFFLGIIGNLPKDVIAGALGNKKGFYGLFRATVAGVLLDMCNHGILMIGAKLYERGLSSGQVMAFLIASPWNSFSLMIILVALIGFKWMLIFLGLSMVIGIITGAIFQWLEGKGTLPANPNRIELAENFSTKQALLEHWRSAEKSHRGIYRVLKEGVISSKIVVKWLLFGIILSAMLQTFVDPETFSTYFGPTLIGLLLTSIAATIIEVCSEGSVPIAADLFNSAGAKGNAFSFLMAGVSTDYTEMLVLREATGSWKLALFLPLITLPQILILAFVMNQF